MQHPAYANRRYSLCIADFVNEAIQAYACGFNEIQLEREIAATVSKQKAENVSRMQVGGSVEHVLLLVPVSPAYAD